ncbi:MAG: AarF/ABC1/UbiB kinase family protein [Thermodesulfovibrionales bacterium]
MQYRIRFLKGLFVALRVVLSYKLAGLVGLFMGREGKRRFIRTLNRRNAALIRRKAIEMKGVMIKVGQFMSSRIDVLPDEFTSELSLLQDQVPPHDYGEIRQRIVEELGAPPEEVFARFNERPIAAASLGQVHEAELKEGGRVAVKVLYPDIENIIETDIRMFKVVIGLLRGQAHGINLDLLHEEFSRIVRGELDYIQEGRNAERFRENFKDFDRLVFPRVYWDYTTKRVLTLEFVDGIKINQCEAIMEADISCKETASLLAEAYARMIYLHGFFHGDPHPGNIFVQPGPRLAFVDFGMVQVVPDRIKKELRRMGGAVVDKDPERIVASLERMGFVVEGADLDAITGLTEYLLEKYRHISPADIKRLTLGDIQKEMENIFGVFDFIQIPNNFILLGRSIGILNGICYALNPEVNIIEIGTPYTKEFLRGGSGEQTEWLLDELREMGKRAWRLPGLVDEFFRKMNRGTISVKLAPSEIDRITRQFSAITNVLMLVILTVTASSAALFLAMMDQKGPSIVAAGTSAALGVLSVIRLSRK